MDFMGCAVAAREEVSVLLAHAPRDVDALKKLAQAVPRTAERFPHDARFLHFLMKREPVRRFFVLSTSRLKWYEEKDVHSSTRSAATYWRLVNQQEVCIAGRRDGAVSGRGAELFDRF